MKTTREYSKMDRFGNREGSLFMTLLVFIFLASIIVASVVQAVSRNTYATHRHICRMRAFNAAEAGINRAVFLLKHDSEWEKVHNDLIHETTLVDHTKYSVKVDSKDETKVIFTSTGEVEFTDGDKNEIVRKIRVTVERDAPAALDFMMFGNDVGFHNHMGEAYGLSISNKVWSNGDIKMHNGLIMEGEFTAVGEIEIDDDDPPTVVDNAILRDGEPDSDYYAPDHDEALPEPKPFPVYNFERARIKAQNAGTYFEKSDEFEDYLLAHTVYINNDGKDNDGDGTKDEPDEREYYKLPIPMRADPDHGIVLKSKDSETGIVSRTEVSGFFYIDDSCKLEGEMDELLIMTDVSIIAPGGLEIARPTEIYSPPDEVMFATEGSIGIKGGGGPVHMEGVSYCMGCTHIHQTDPYDAVYFAGIEIADYIHNCEWFRQEYKPYPFIYGLSDSAEGAPQVIVYGWHEVE